MHPRWKLLTAAAAIVLSTSVASAEDCPEGPDEAKCLLTQAQALRDSDPAAAANLYLRSYRIEPKIDPLAAYGSTLALAEQYVPAVEALEKAVEEYEKIAAEMQASNADAKATFAMVHRIQFVREELNKLASHVGKVLINVPDKKLPPGITVIRKGGDVLLRSSDPTRLVVGLYGDILVWTYPSGRTFEQKVNVSAGTFSKIDVPPEPPPAPPPALPPPPPPPINDGSDRMIGSYIAGGVATVMLIWGVAYLSLADGASPAVSGVLIGGGVVVGAGAIYLYLTADQMKKDAKEERIRRGEKEKTVIIPVITDQMVGAMISGTL
jgi:hypothetical protein